jgi:hypothetical protein
MYAMEGEMLRRARRALFVIFMCTHILIFYTHIHTYTHTETLPPSGLEQVALPPGRGGGRRGRGVIVFEVHNIHIGEESK